MSISTGAEIGSQVFQHAMTALSMLTWQKTTLSTPQRQLSVWTDGPLSELPRLCPSFQSFSLPL